MNIGNYPAFPVVSPDRTDIHLGLTINQYYAGLAMQALIVRWNEGSESHANMVSQLAIEYADEMTRRYP